MQPDSLSGGQDALKLKSRGGVVRVFKAAGYSLAGLRAAFIHEAAFRQLLLLAFWLPVTGVERALMVGVVLLALIVELINSAIEAVVDRISLELHPLSKRAKDLGSAAQMLALLLITSVWSLILFSPA